MSKVEIDGVAFDIAPEVAGLLQAVSEERDEAISLLEKATDEWQEVTSKWRDRRIAWIHKTCLSMKN